MAYYFGIQDSQPGNTGVSTSTHQKVESQTATHEGKKLYLARTLGGTLPKFTTKGIDTVAKVTLIRKKTVEPPDLNEKRNYSVIDCLDLPTDSSLRLQRRCLSMVFTHKEYMEMALYHPKFGYYTTRPGIGTDFVTTPVTCSPYYGAAMAEIIMKLWKGMVEAGTFKKDERVDICELGAGTGVLARDIVCHIRTSAIHKGKDWKQLFDNLSYKIGEISETLRGIQAKEVNSFSDKFKIIPADARQLEKTFPKDSLKGFILSNELLDAFSSHKIRKNARGELEVAIVVPIVTNFEDFIRKYHKYLQPIDSGYLSKIYPRIFKENQILASLLKPEYGFTPSTETVATSYRFLSKQTYKLLKQQIDAPFFDLHAAWREFWVPATSVEEVNELVPDHGPFFKHLPINKPTPLNTSLRTFQEGCSNALEKGFQLSIDYQYDLLEILSWQTNSFRTYPKKVGQYYSKPPGEEDITANVSATALAVEGVRANFEPFLYCIESEMLSMAPTNIVKHIMLHRQGLPFNTLIMKKKGTLTTYKPEVVTRAVTYRDLCLTLSDWSSSAIPGMRYIKEAVSMVSSEIYQEHKKRASYLKKIQPIEYRYIRHTIVSRIAKGPPILIEAASFLCEQLFSKEFPLFDMAKEHTSIEDFDYKKIIPLFTTLKTADGTDKLIIQMVHQLLHFYYTDLGKK